MPPKSHCSDNGPEFIANALQDWLKDLEIEILYIKPGFPWGQTYIESFHDKLRDELLYREILGSLSEAHVILDPGAANTMKSDYTAHWAMKHPQSSQRKHRSNIKPNT